MFFITLLVFILVIGVLVLVHELGHFLAARAVGIRVEEFAIGMGPRVWGWRKGETEYNLRAFPIGGYVRMFGEGDYEVEAEGSYGSKKPSLRLIVLVAGVFMNMVLATLIFYAQGVRQDFRYISSVETIFEGEFNPWFGEKSEGKLIVSDISESSPFQGKVERLDTIMAIHDVDYDGREEFDTILTERIGQETTFELVNYSLTNSYTITVTPRADPPEGEKALGIVPLPVSFIEYNGAGKLFSGVGQALNNIQIFGFVIGQLVGEAFEEKTIAPVANTFGGAIGIFDFLQITILVIGFWGVLELAALFSVNLAIFNILPIPALDGGHVLFTLMEMVTRRKLPSRVYNIVTMIGFVLLFSFMILITSLDLVKHTNVRNWFCNDNWQVGFICELADYRR